MIIPDRFEWTRQPGTGPDPAVLGELRGATVVEVGCGSGHNLAHLVTHHGVHGIGIDHDPGKIERAIGLYGQLPGIAFRLGDGAQTLARLEPGSVDLCVSIFGALSFSEPGPLLTAAGRALRPHGRLALTLRADDDHDWVAVLTKSGQP